MNTTIQHHVGEKFEIEIYFEQQFKGRGGWNINCTVSFKSEKKTFSHYTTDSMFIDKISDMKTDDASWADIQQAYKEHAFDKIEQDILEWCESVIEEDSTNYVIRDREAGNIIGLFNDLDEAKNALNHFEENDKADGTYSPDFYEIVPA